MNIPNPQHTTETIIGTFTYETEDTTSEKLEARFPALTAFNKKRKLYEVKTHPATTEQLRREYGSALLHAANVERLYVHMGIIDCYALEATKTKTSDQLDDLGAMTASPDNLNRQILDDVSEPLQEASEHLQRKLLLYIGEELAADVSRINGFRFSAGVMVASEPDNFSGLSHEMRRRLEERMLGDEPSYMRAARPFTATIEDARQAFAETIPLYEIACSYPMPEHEVHLLHDVLREPKSSSLE